MEESHKELVEQEALARDKEAQSYDARLRVRYFKEIPSTISSLRPWQRKKIIDYGCGTGRVSENLSGVKVWGVDISSRSLHLFKEKKTQLQELNLILADATEFRAEPKSFDKALSSQVYEHIPTKERRINFLKNVSEALKDDGVFVATVYHQDLRRRLSQESPEGKHPSGIFYRYFRSKELREEFKLVFPNVSIHPIDITLPFEARLKLSPKIGGLISRVCEYLPGINQFGHLLHVVARKV